MRQLVLDLPRGADFSEQAWLTTKGTQAAEEALRQVDAKCVCVYGPVGAGKTHLLAMTGLRDAKLLVVDDLEGLDGGGQEMLFHEFNKRAGKNIVVASILPVAQLPLLADLKSRLLTGTQAEMMLPDDGELRALLNKWAVARQLVLPAAVVEFLLVRADRNPRHLLALVAKLDSLGMEHKRGMTVPLAKQVLEKE